MARWPKTQVGVAPTVPAAMAAAPAAPPFDNKRPHDDAHEGSRRYWVQNGWLYRRGSGEPVREVAR